MRRVLTNKLALFLRGCVLAAMGAAMPFMAQAANSNQTTAVIMVPGIWVDPDGCEHWVMDDGWEGFMSPVIMPDGRPVCGRDPNGPVACGIVTADRFLATDSAALSAQAVAGLRQFFRADRARVFVIEGHTDSRASDAYNLELSKRRALAVAQIAQSEGVKVKGIRGMGERAPRATNATAAGRAMNRRVEILCVR